MDFRITKLMPREWREERCWTILSVESSSSEATISAGGRR